MNILITGVSKGLGLVLTESLLQNGHSVYGISRSKTDKLEELLSQYSHQLRWIGYDLTQPDDLRKTVFKDWIGFDCPIHGYVNNAALAYDDIATNANLKSLRSMFEVNVFAPINLTKYVIRHMLLHNVAGSLVHVSSISVHTGYKGLSMYAASKGALEAFSKNIAREWGEKGIRSNCLVAGFMNTEMSASLSDEQKNRIFNRTSLKKPVEIKSVSDTIEFLLSPASISITGQNIHVDNGTI